MCKHSGIAQDVSDPLGISLDKRCFLIYDLASVETGVHVFMTGPYCVGFFHTQNSIQLHS